MRAHRMVFVQAALVATIAAAITVSYCGGSTGPGAPSTPTAASFAQAPSAGLSTPQCDASLWSHVHDQERLQIAAPCKTVTGVITDFHQNDDGDIDIRVAVDPPYAGLLNGGNVSDLSGHLQTEAICQAPIAANVPDALRACRNFTGTIQVPAVGTRVQITGVYTFDTNHGWMEIHPISVLTVIH